jgi:hypothetical protein
MNTWIYLLHLYSTWIQTVLDVQRVHRQRGYPCSLARQDSQHIVKLTRGHRMITIRAQGFPAMQKKLDKHHLSLFDSKKRALVYSYIPIPNIYSNKS